MMLKNKILTINVIRMIKQFTVAGLASVGLLVTSTLLTVRESPPPEERGRGPGGTVAVGVEEGVFPEELVLTFDLEDLAGTAWFC